MGISSLRCGLACAGVWLLSAAWAAGEDWPQWRGPDRDARATGFNAPEDWPNELSQKWKVTVGDGVATPAVVGDRVFVFSREDGNEVIRALNAASGEEIWQDKYETEAPRGGASNFPGPRSSPTVAGGTVVTLGARGRLCCHDVATGREVWCKSEFENEVPDFFVASSPIVVDGVVIAQLGGEDDGGILAYDLASGRERWRWTDDAPAYGSPVLMTIDGTQVIVAPTDKNLVAVGVADGKTVWEMPYEQGRYNTATPIVDGNTLIIAGPGTGLTALKIMKVTRPDDSVLVEERVWRNTDNSLQFNTPVLKDGLLFGLSNAGQLFCIDTRNRGQTAWAVALNPQPAERRDEEQSVENARDAKVRAALVQFVQQEDRDRRGRDGREGFDRDRRRGEGPGRPADGRGGGRGGRRGRGGSGYGSVVDAGDVLLALSPAGELVVFRPNDEAYLEVARYKVAEEGTYAYPVAVGDAIYIKDRETLARWGLE